jgi:hypothetical protein
MISSLKHGLILEQEVEKSTDLNEFNVIKLLMESTSQRSEELRLYNLI